MLREDGSEEPCGSLCAEDLDLPGGHSKDGVGNRDWRIQYGRSEKRLRTFCWDGGCFMPVCSTFLIAWGIFSSGHMLINNRAWCGYVLIKLYLQKQAVGSIPIVAAFRSFILTG